MLFIFLVFGCVNVIYGQSINDGIVFFPKSCIDAGDIPEKGYHTFLFPFQNVSGKAIQVEMVKSSCGCLNPKWKKHVIAAGSWDTIIGQYDTEFRPGHFTKTLRVRFIGIDNDITLIVKGNVIPYRGKISFKYYPKMDEVKRRDDRQIYVDKPTPSNLILLVQNMDSFPMQLTVTPTEWGSNYYESYFCSEPTIAKNFKDIQERNGQLFFQEVKLLPMEKTFLVYLFKGSGIVHDEHSKILVNGGAVTLIISDK